MGIFIGSSKEFADTIACPKKARRFFSQRTLKVHEETFILPYLFLCDSSLTEASRVGGLRLRGKIFVSTVFTFTSLNIKVLSLSQSFCRWQWSRCWAWLPWFWHRETSLSRNRLSYRGEISEIARPLYSTGWTSSICAQTTAALDRGNSKKAAVFSKPKPKGLQKVCYTMIATFIIFCSHFS